MCWLRATALCGLLFVSVVTAAAVPNRGELVFAHGFDPATVYPGGVNYLWHRLDRNGATCDREPYGLLPNYHLPGVRAAAQQQLAAMHAGGMRSLSLGIHPIHGTHSGTLIDASDPVAVAQVAENLASLLDDVHAAGFGRVLFRFFPQGSMNPSFAAWNPALLDEYWSLVETFRAVLAAGDVPYYIDLLVEGAPNDDNSLICRNGGRCDPANPAWSNAVRELWRRYRVAYGVADTVGFSFLTAANRSRARVRHMKYVYEGTYPPVFAMDFYGEQIQPDGTHSELDQFIDMANLMASYGSQYGFPADTPWIISEAYYNDPYAAAGISTAIAGSRLPVLYLTEWPLDRAATCDQVSEPPPYDFDIWRMYGF